MAKVSKKKSRSKSEGDASDLPSGAESRAIANPARRFEVIGVLMLVVALALCFALFSFDPADGAGRGNLVGPIGVHLANALLGGVGVIGYVVAVGLTIVAVAVIVGRIVRPSFLSILSALAITVGASVLAHLALRDPILGHPAGGLLGSFLGEAMKKVGGAAGSALVAMGVLMIGVLGISDLSLGAALRDAWGALRWVGLRISGLVEAQREAREAARIREEELVEAELSRRAQAKLEAEEREAKLREELEEKKRIAVLKATTKAEEKALQKLAALEAKERIEKAEREAEEKARAEEEARAKVEAEAFDVIAAASARATQLPRQKTIAEVEREVAEVELAIPGPAAEPKIVIAERPKKGAADVLAELEGAEPPRSRPATRKMLEAALDAALDDEVDEDREDDRDDALDDERDEDSELPAKTGASSEEEDDGEIRVYERKQIDTELLSGEHEPAAAPAEKPAAPKLQKRVFEMPPLHLLDYEGKAPEPIDPELLRSKATRLEEKLKTYGVEGRVAAIRPGPVVTTYEYLPAPGVKVSKIAALSDDIAMSMEAMRVRIVAPIPGKGVVGIELPNEKREAVYLKELIAHDSFKKGKSLLTLALGKDAEGEPQTRDLRSMPHILVAGTTGSGKSVSVNAMILSILYKATPDQVKFIMVDPKMLELSLYEDIPHLLLPVVTDPRKASLALQWAVDEMERRYQMLSDFKVRDLDGFNKKLAKLAEQREADAKLAESERRRLEAEAAAAEAESEGQGDALALDAIDGAPQVESTTSKPPETATSGVPAKHDDNSRIKDPWAGKDIPEPLPYIVVLIDEFADLMCVAPRDVEASVQRLAQKARAAGIHVMLATQRPSTDVITGVIKNNFPTRISFRVASRHDSATILNAPGAENLLGMGDMLCLGVTSPSPVRIHGAFVSEEEVQRVVDFWKAQAKPTYDATILQKRDDDGDGDGDDPVEHDEMYDKAVAIVTETRKASISAIQRRLRVGYNRAARMIEMMETEGIVGPAMGPKGEREVLVRAAPPVD